MRRNEHKNLRYEVGSCRYPQRLLYRRPSESAAERSIDGLSDMVILVASRGRSNQWMETVAMASQNPERFLRLAAVLDRTGLSRATLYRKIHAGTFPQQVKLAERCCGWRESAVEQWLINPMHYSASDAPKRDDERSMG